MGPLDVYSFSYAHSEPPEEDEMETTSRILPTAWNDTRDVPFFQITSRLLSAQFCLGATVLLATYDDEPVPTPAASPASSGVAPRLGDDLASVRVSPTQGSG